MGLMVLFIININERNNQIQSMTYACDIIYGDLLYLKSLFTWFIYLL